MQDFLRFIDSHVLGQGIASASIKVFRLRPPCEQIHQPIVEPFQAGVELHSKDREYGKMLQDDARLLSLLREGVDENDIFLKATDELLVLRDLLVNRFGTGKIAS